MSAYSALSQLLLDGCARNEFDRPAVSAPAEEGLNHAAETTPQPLRTRDLALSECRRGCLIKKCVLGAAEQFRCELDRHVIESASITPGRT
jgi:hypothetical protein